MHLQCAFQIWNFHVNVIESRQFYLQQIYEFFVRHIFDEILTLRKKKKRESRSIVEMNNHLEFHTFYSRLS